MSSFSVQSRFECNFLLMPTLHLTVFFFFSYHLSVACSAGRNWTYLKRCKNEKRGSVLSHTVIQRSIQIISKKKRVTIESHIVTAYKQLFCSYSKRMSGEISVISTIDTAHEDMIVSY